MKAHLVGIYDRAAQAYISLEPTPSIAVTARQFTETVNTNTEAPMYKFPSDFELYELGTWETTTGMVQPVEPPRLIVAAKDVKQRNGQ